MNTQERDMIDGLFDRLQQAQAQSGPRDAEADAHIRERMAEQPAAGYLLAQVVLVQEQALKNLQGRVEGLERQLAERPQGGGGFLGGLFGVGQDQPASQPASATMAKSGGGWGNPTPATRGAAAIPRGSQGGGFMAGAMQTAMGVAGGMLLANAVAGMFSGEAQAAESPAAPEPAASEPPAAEEQELAAEDPGADDEGLFGGMFGGDDEMF